MMKYGVLLLGWILIGAAPLGARPLTALEARAVAQKVLSADAKDKVIQILGPRSPQEITPTTWQFVFWDPNAKQNGRLITVAGTAVTEIRDGYIELDKMRLAAYKTDEIIDPKQLHIDSDAAFNVVKASAQLKDVRLSSIIYSLRKTDDYVDPIWKIQVFADKEGKETDIGYARVSATTGQIVELKFDLEKLVRKS